MARIGYTASMNRTILMLFLILTGLVTAQEMETKIYQLNAAPAESVVETVRGVLSPGGTAAPEPRLNKLIVRDTPEVLSRVDKIIQELDQYAPQVRIYVTMHGGAQSVQSGVNVGVSRGRVRAGVGVGTTDSQMNSQQNLVVMSGGKGVIHVARDVVSVSPYQNFAQQLGLLPPNLVVQSVGTGFEVEPVVVGNVVRLKVTPWMSFVGPGGGQQVSVTQAGTTLAVKSGQTVTVSSGGYSQEMKNQAFGLVFGVGNGSYSTSSTVELRPVIIDEPK